MSQKDLLLGAVAVAAASIRSAARLGGARRRSQAVASWWRWLPGAASDARRAVHAVAAGEVADGYAMALAATEAVTNVIVHAYRDRAPDSDPGVRAESPRPFRFPRGDRR